MGVLGGAMPIVGVAKVCLFGACAVPVANLTRAALGRAASGGTATVAAPST